MNEILKKAQPIILKAQEDDDFLADNTDNLRGTGESSADYSIYEFDLSDDYSLLIDFIDLSYEGFSIVNKNHKDFISKTYRVAD